MRFTQFLNETSDREIMKLAKSMEWYGTSVNAVCAKALKERSVGLLNRANEYLLNNQSVKKK